MIFNLDLILKYYLNRLFSPRYLKSGKCKQCGNCCRSIILADDGKNITSVAVFEKLKLKYKKYNHFTPIKKDENGDILFQCNSLGEDNRCKDYFFRSIYCRKYPNIDKKFIMAGGKMLDGCGYKIEPTKKFSHYLD